MIVPPDMKNIEKIASALEAEIRALEEQVEEEKCQDKINELRAEIRKKGMALFGYQRTLNSIKYN